MLRKKRILKFLSYALDYAPIIITVLFATVASLIAINNDSDVPELMQWTLAILALMATTQLIDRFRILRSIDYRIEKLSDSSRGDVSANDFFNTFPNLEERMKTAKSISICGISLARTSVNLWTVLHERLNKKAPVRILLVDPDHSIIDVAAYRLYRHQDPIRSKSEIENALGNFESLYSNIHNNSLFQLRLIPYVPPYGIWIIDGGTEKAELWVEIYSFRADTEPAFRLVPNRDLEWFSHFEQQFEKMWDVGRDWEPTREKK